MGLDKSGMQYHVRDSATNVTSTWFSHSVTGSVIPANKRQCSQLQRGATDVFNKCHSNVCVKYSLFLPSTREWCRHAQHRNCRLASGTHVRGT